MGLGSEPKLWLQIPLSLVVYCLVWIKEDWWISHLMKKTTESQQPEVERHVISAPCLLHLYISYSARYVIGAQCVGRMMDGWKDG